MYVVSLNDILNFIEVFNLHINYTVLGLVESSVGILDVRPNAVGCLDGLTVVAQILQRPLFGLSLDIGRLGHVSNQPPLKL